MIHKRFVVYCRVEKHLYFFSSKIALNVNFCTILCLIFFRLLQENRSRALPSQKFIGEPIKNMFRYSCLQISGKNSFLLFEQGTLAFFSSLQFYLYQALFFEEVRVNQRTICSEVLSLLFVSLFQRKVALIVCESPYNLRTIITEGSLL